MAPSRFRDRSYRPPRLAVMLLGVALGTAALMLAFESTKQLFFPHITIWRSHALTICFTTLVAVGAAFVVGSRLLSLNRVLEHLVEDRTTRVKELEEAQVERKRLEQQLLQAQKMDAIGRLAGGIAHDFNNLLTVIFGHCSWLMGKVKDRPDLAEDVTAIQTASDRAAALTRHLLAFSRQQVLQPTVLNLNSVVQNMGQMLRRLISENISLRTVADHDLGSVKADRGQIEQVILNLAVNARDAMPKGGKLTLETANIVFDEAYTREHATVEAGRYVMVAVSDTGTGMDTDTQARIFEPFFTTKEVGKGTGLGLATVYGIVKQSGGYIWVYSEVGRGTTFKIYLPRVDATAAEVPGDRPMAEPQQGTETILLVEDSAELLALASKSLSSCGYSVLAAHAAAEAETSAARHMGDIDLLLTDVVMPGGTGWELAERLSQQRPRMKVLYMSGYTQDGGAHQAALIADIAYLQKPFTPLELTTKVRSVLDAEKTASATPAD